MPYIPEESRDKVDGLLDTLADEMCAHSETSRTRAGMANYVITRILNKLWPTDRYLNFVLVMGTLMCVGLEFYRRRAAPYEDKKKEENGDIEGYCSG